MAKSKNILLVIYDWPMDDFDAIYSSLSLRTSLEELLDWNETLVDYLTGAWSTIPACKARSTTVALYVGQLPPKEYKKYSKKLEKWLLINYNSIVR